MDVVRHFASLEDDMKTQPGAVVGTNQGDIPEFPSQHFFANGVYCRQTFNPKGSRILGRIHRYPTISILQKGKLLIKTPGEDEWITHEAPDIWESPGRCQRAVIALEDSWLVTTHPVDPSYTEADLDKIAQEVIMEREELL